MRSALVHTSYDPGSAEIAGSWPLAEMAYLPGHLKATGYKNSQVINAMTNTDAYSLLP